MKKFFFIVSVLSYFLLSGTYAQTLKPALGINLTDFSRNAATGNHVSRVGFQVGAGLAFGQKFYFEPGVFYVAKSTQFEVENSSDPEVKYSMGGIRIPFTVGYGLFTDQNAPLNVRILGGAAAFILTNTKEMNKDDLNKASVGVFAGAGVDIIHLLFVELKYEWSLSDIYKEDVPFDIGRTRSLFIHAGVHIPLNR